MTKRANAAPERAAGIVDVATHAGVSISTVSNVLNGTKSVSAELRARVLAAVEALGYSANTLAKGLKSGRTNTLCVLVPSIVSVFFPEVLRGMQMAAAYTGSTFLPPLTGLLIRATSIQVVPYVILLLIVAAFFLTERIERRVQIGRASGATA